MRPEIDRQASYIASYGSVKCEPEMKEIISSIWQAFNQNLVPQLTEEGTSGAYRMRNVKKKCVAIFKAVDEE